MKLGKKATGQSSIEKMIVTRHGNGGGKRAANAEERTIERRVRREGKKAGQRVRQVRGLPAVGVVSLERLLTSSLLSTTR
jgi:hypothetical protein